MARLGWGRTGGVGLRCASGEADAAECSCCAPFMLGRRGLLAGGGALLAGAPGLAQAQAPVREISQIAGNLYRFRNNFHYSVFAVTPAGIIATDPINAEAAGWLKAQFKERFNQTARYVVYSHDHSDHISGGEVFADTAVFVAQERARDAIVGEKRQTPAPSITFAERMRLEPLKLIFQSSKMSIFTGAIFTSGCWAPRARPLVGWLLVIKSRWSRVRPDGQRLNSLLPFVASVRGVVFKGAF